MLFVSTTTWQARQLDVPDVQERRKEIDAMQCGNFEWFMKNIAPDTHIVPYKDIISHGEVSDNNLCKIHVVLYSLNNFIIYFKQIGAH